MSVFEMDGMKERSKIIDNFVCVASRQLKDDICCVYPDNIQLKCYNKVVTEVANKI